MSGSLDPQYHREPGSKWPGFLVNRSGLPISEETWTQVWAEVQQNVVFNLVLLIDLGICGSPLP